MKQTYKILSLAVAIIMAAGSALAQENGISSPYSRYGFGQLGTLSTGFNSAMAGIGIGMQNGREVNPINPASYAGLDSLTFLFDIGASVQQSNYRGSGKAHHTDVTFDYMTMGFRAAKHLGLSIGVLPISHVGYNASSTSTVTDSYNHSEPITRKTTYTGNGGLHEVYIGAGWAPVRYVSVGANIGYVWGDINNATSVTFSDATVTPSSYTYLSEIRTYNVSAGLQTYIPLNKHNTLTLGANYTLGHQVNRKAYMIKSATDTLLARNAYELPHTIGAGASWNHKNKLRIGVDYLLQKWGQCRYPWYTRQNGVDTYQATTGYLRDSWRVAAGAEYRPLKKGMRWSEYITYRAGFAITTPYVNVEGANGVWAKGPTSYLATVGVNLPIMNVFGGRCSVNLAAQYERSQPAFAGQIKENYFRLCIGVNFNEQWFMKWKVN